MPRGYRGHRDKIVAGTFFIFCALVLAAAFLSFGALKGRQSERAAHAPYEYEQSAKKEAQRVCAVGPPASIFECIYEHVEASKQTSHDHEDLHAQQVAAWSAALAASATILSLGLSFLGLWYIYDTLRETRRAVAITDETARRELRAYVAVNHVRVSDYKVAGKLKISLNLENVGSTIAKSVEIIAFSAGDLKGGEDKREIMRKFFVKFDLAPKASHPISDTILDDVPGFFLGLGGPHSLSTMASLDTGIFTASADGRRSIGGLSHLIWMRRAAGLSPSAADTIAQASAIKIERDTL